MTVTDDLVTRDRVLETSAQLPGFPTIIIGILESIEDPESNLHVLAGEIQLDPLITGRVMALANAVAMRSRRQHPIDDLHSAISMIGLGAVRRIAVTCSFPKLYDENASSIHQRFIRHSVSVSACCSVLAKTLDTSVSIERATIAGLLHDIGSLWLLRFERSAFERALNESLQQRCPLSEVETMYFGCDHARIGRWLAEQWVLPDWLLHSIEGHHDSKATGQDPLTAMVHIGEVLADALELQGADQHRVHTLHPDACRLLGLEWDASSQELFSRIESESRFANHLVD